MKKFYFILLVPIILIIVGVVCVRVITIEDAWVCQNGNWIKHGQPEGLMPIEPCLNNLATSCEQAGGIWQSAYDECEAMSQDWCQQNNGNFNECESACRHNPSTEICTMQCVAVCSFLDDEVNSEKDYLSYKDLIKVFDLKEDDSISSPLIIEGEARGNWFFEASFPVVLTDWDGLIIAEGIATAQSDWMTEDFVKFEAELTFEKPVVNSRGALILKKR